MASMDSYYVFTNFYELHRRGYYRAMRKGDYNAAFICAKQCVNALTKRGTYTATSMLPYHIAHVIRWHKRALQFNIDGTLRVLFVA